MTFSLVTIGEPLSEYYVYSYLSKMSAVPQGAFATRKVRQNEEKLKNIRELCDLTPTKYSSKYMNSVWGMYNRYSVHNFKKNIDEGVFHFKTEQQEIIKGKHTAEKNSDLFAPGKSFLQSPGIL